MIFLLIKKTKTLNIREYKLFILFYLDYKFDEHLKKTLIKIKKSLKFSFFYS